jgi:protein-disulfide isomerase
MPKRLLALALTPALTFFACSRAEQPVRAAAPAATPAAVAPGAPVAEFDGGTITAAELDERAAGRLARVRQEEFEIRSQVLDELLAERLVAIEAKKRGISSEALLAQEVDAKAQKVPDSQVDAIYEQNKTRFGSATRDEAIAQIRRIMQQRAVDGQRAEYEHELRQAASVKVLLEAPRVAVDIPKGAPSTGAASAPVTIVEFTDYQCPYCHRSQSVIEEVLARYSGQVRLVHLDFPLDGHPQALPAARAARCAGEQGRFWDYHKSLMTQAGSFDDADLEGRASALKLNASRFKSCLASDRFDASIQAELRQGAELGVTGTPAYFVNGRLLSGAHPIESFEEVIDAELGTAQGG